MSPDTDFTCAFRVPSWHDIGQLPQQSKAHSDVIQIKSLCAQASHCQVYLILKP